MATKRTAAVPSAKRATRPTTRRFNADTRARQREMYEPEAQNVKPIPKRPTGTKPRKTR